MIEEIQAYAESIGHPLTNQRAGLIVALASMAPEKPSVDDLHAWITRS